ncbi:hypothetical protein JAAARDRAFT_140755, partial [Jaapia argillacea MUCL 33604]
LAWPLHTDGALLQSGRPTGLNIYTFLSRIAWWVPLLPRRSGCVVKLVGFCFDPGSY